MSEVTLIKNAISVWNQDCNKPDAAKASLRQGSIFNITRNEFKKWSELKNIPEWIYAYYGDFNGVLKFVLVDSETAKKPLDESTLPYTFVMDFNRNYSVKGLDFISVAKAGNIEINDALQRIMRWNIMMDSWIEQQTTSTDSKGVTKAFTIPYASVKNLFDNSNVDELVAVLGLNIVGSLYQADLILWATSSIKEAGDLKVENIIKPCPPYCELPTWP